MEKRSGQYVIEDKTIGEIICFLKTKQEFLRGLLSSGENQLLNAIIYLGQIEKTRKNSEFLVYCIDTVKQDMKDEVPYYIRISHKTYKSGLTQPVYSIHKKNNFLVTIDYTKIGLKGHQIIATDINFSSSGKLNHPILEELMEKSEYKIDRFSQLLKNHILQLEKDYPEYEDFFYEFDSDLRGSWYNLMGLGKPG